MIFDATAGGRTFRVEVRSQDGAYRLTVDGREVDVDLVEAGRGFLNLRIGGQSRDAGVQRVEGGYTVSLSGRTVAVSVAEGARGAVAVARHASGPTKLTAPMPGKIVRLLAAVGDEVAAHQGLVVMEAMKMENELRSPRAARVREVLVREGQAVETGALLAILE